MYYKFVENICDDFLKKNNVYSDFKTIEEYDSFKRLFTNKTYNAIKSIRENHTDEFDNFKNLPNLDKIDIINDYINRKHNPEYEVLNEFVETIFSVAIIVILSYYLGKDVLNYIFKHYGTDIILFTKNISKFVYDVGTFLRKKSKYEDNIIRHDVALKNFKECYKQAGIKKDDVTYKQAKYIHYSNNPVALKGMGVLDNMSVEDQRKVITLQRCYMVQYINIISILYNSYLRCLKKSDYNQYQEVLGSSTFELAAMSQGMSSYCDEYRIKYKESLEYFEKLIKYFYDIPEEYKDVYTGQETSKRRRSKMEHIELLNKKLSQEKKKFQKPQQKKWR